MDSSYVPFQLMDADEFEALEVAIAAAERSSTSSCKKSKFSIPFSPASSSHASCRDTSSAPLCESTISGACSPLSAPVKLSCALNLHHSEFRTSNGAVENRQSSYDSLHAAKEGRASSTESLGNGYVRSGCDVFHKHSEGEPSCGLSSRSGDAARLLQNAAEESERAYQGDFRSNAHGDNSEADVNGSILHPHNLDELSKALSFNAGLVYEAEEAATLSHEVNHSKPRCSRRLPSWQSYAGSHRHNSLRPLGQIIQRFNSVDEEAQLASPSDFPRDLGIDNSRLPWGLAPSTCRVAPKCKLPSLQFKGRIIYSVTRLDAESAAHELLRLVEAKKAAVGNLVPLGFDTEWKVVFKRGAQPRKVAVLQLCIDADHCNVFHVIYTGIPSPLRTILEDPLVFKVGVGAYGDAAKLFTDYNVKVKGVKDLSGLANLKLAGTACGKRSWSLASLAEELLGKQVDKNRSIRMGDWEVEELSEAQLHYAATDAFASLYLFQVLLTFPDPQKEVSPAIGCNT